MELSHLLKPNPHNIVRVPEHISFTEEGHKIEVYSNGDGTRTGIETAIGGRVIKSTTDHKHGNGSTEVLYDSQGATKFIRDPSSHITTTYRKGLLSDDWKFNGRYDDSGRGLISGPNDY